jgi:aminoglycoside phosphotransferase family enzyme/predicted kinase
VLPIGRDESGWCLGGWTEPGEYTLVMRRLPEKRMLSFLLDTEQASGEMMAELAKVLARFHTTAERVRGIDPSEYALALQTRWKENLTDLEPFLNRDVDRDALAAIRRAGAVFFQEHQTLLMRRAADGWIRDVHGDLHTEHICFAPEGIQIFDCLEFSGSLRRCDLASEIAFLTMDLAARGGASLRAPLLDAYRELLFDSDMTELLPFFECYRALVRAKVHVLRTGGWNDETARYFGIAQRFGWARSKPFVVLICGLPGSGKSTLARALGERVQMHVYNSDVIRKKNFKAKGRRTAALNRGIYGPAATSKTYASLERSAEKEILAGNGAILDATFGRKSQRMRIARLAGACKTPLIVIHCSLSHAATALRLRLRTAQGTDVSDARWDTYVALKAAYEPIDELTPECILELDTDAPVEELVRRCERFLRLRLL